MRRTLLSESLGQGFGSSGEFLCFALNRFQGFFMCFYSVFLGLLTVRLCRILELSLIGFMQNESLASLLGSSEDVAADSSATREDRKTK